MTPAAAAASDNRTRPDIVPTPEPLSDWQAEFRRSLRSSKALREACGLPTQSIPSIDFPVLAPWPYISRMRWGDAQDPLLLQVLSQAAETVAATGFGKDPVGETQATPVPGLIHKYAGRALIIATQACAVHCRYCFRREFPYSEHAQGRLQPALDHLQERPDIQEIILSGGDPLMLDDERLNQLITALEQIPHLRTLRLHTRLPIVIPQRVTPSLVNRLQRSRLQVISIVHSNHPAELDATVDAALSELRRVGPVLNQAVLLAGVNDAVDTLAQLSHALFRSGTLPYYLHVLDKVEGAAHFDLPEQQAMTLHAQLQEQLPGYLLPRLVREIPGRAHKTILR
nr:EF-P beta-lysylation protein EpmB [Oceanococcus sp. HetDA_MAG_MS8]